MSKELGITSITAPQLSSNPFASLFNQGPSSSLSSSLNIPEGVGLSQESSTPIGNGSAQNSAQSAMKEKSNLQKAFEGVQSLYDPMGGRPIAGSEGIRVRADAYGRPYTVVSMTPTGSGGYESAADLANTNRLGKFQDKQAASQASSLSAASTPAAIQSEKNRQQLIQSKISSMPKGASITEEKNQNGMTRTVTGPSGYAQAFIPKEEEEIV